MLFKSFTAAALLLTTALSSPLSISIDISEDSLLTHAFSTHEEPVRATDKGGIESVMMYLSLHTKTSEKAAKRVAKIKQNQPYEVASFLADVYRQYVDYNTSAYALPIEVFSEDDGQKVVDKFYDLGKALESQFESVVETKDALASHDLLAVYLLSAIYHMDDHYDLSGSHLQVYNDGLYKRLPTESQKEEFTDYSAAAAAQIENAKDALQTVVAQMKPKHLARAKSLLTQELK